MFEEEMNEKKDEVKLKGKNVTEAEEVKEILSVVSKEIPSLIKNIFSSLYNPEMAADYGRGIGELYTELKEKGLPEDMIRGIVMKYAESINIIGEAVKSETSGKSIKIKTEKDEDEDED